MTQSEIIKAIKVLGQLVKANRLFGDGLVIDAANEKIKKLIPLLDEFISNDDSINTIGDKHRFPKVLLKHKDAQTFRASKIEDLYINKDHMKVIFEQSRSTDMDFESWFKFNYQNYTE